MKVSAAGVSRLEKREGVRLTMYRDSAGLPTIGVGHLLTKDELSSGKIQFAGGAVDWHAGLTSAQVAELLGSDLALAELVINYELASIPRLDQHQFDSLASFVFNVGVDAFRRSTLLKRLRDGNLLAVPDQMARWVFAAGAVDPILVKRREDEIAQWDNIVA